MSARVILPWVVVLLIAAGTPAQNTKEELDKLQGEWTMASLEERGKKVSDKLVKQYQLTIKENQWIVSLSGGQGRKMTFEIDPSKDPKTMDLTVKVKDRVTISRGIYKLEGDTLTLCRTTGNIDRPREFKTTAEAGILVELNRSAVGGFLVCNFAVRRGMPSVNNPTSRLVRQTDDRPTAAGPVFSRALDRQVARRSILANRLSLGEDGVVAANKTLYGVSAMRKSALTSLAICLALAVTPCLRADEASRAVIEKAVRAHGGEGKLGKLRALRMKTKGTVVINGNTALFTADSCRQLPDRSKVSILLEVGEVKLSLVQVQNGKKAWSSVEGETEELKGERLAEQQARTHQLQVQSLLPLLKDKAYTLSPLGEIKVNDRPAVGIKATLKGQADVNLYFDKENGLLLKSERRGLDLNQKEIGLETFYSDYKEVNGLKQPMKWVSHHDGKQYMELEVTELKLEDAIDDSEFAKP